MLISISHTNTRAPRWAWMILGVAVTASGCGSSPLAPSIGASALFLPADGAQIAAASQPIILTVQNATMSGGTAPTYTFEVATDTAFATKVQTKSGIAQGNGQTSVTLDALAPGTDYYWHARAQTPATTGTFGGFYKFTVGGDITISAPTPVTPLNGTEASIHPTLTVTNANRQGPFGTIVYVFELSPVSSFSTISASATVSEGSGRTSFTPSANLSPSQAYFWRATAKDQTNNVSGPASATQGFTTAAKTAQGDLAIQLGVTLWPNAQPTGTVGHAILGDNWEVQTLHHLPTNTFFTSPTVEQLRYFDLFDRGYDPQGAIDWLNGHGYPSDAQWYPPPEKAVLGFKFVYLAARNLVVTHGVWDLILKEE
jgi:hypothetical protein